jgi:hypothetical protein
MKSFAFALTLLMSAQVFAFSGKLPPANNHSGQEQCAFYDAGSTEEHRPHTSMQECQALHNGKCDMRCYIYESKCSVTGKNVRYERQADGSERRVEETKTYTGQDRDEREAREIARYNCERDIPRNESCQIQSCDDVAERTK